MTTEQTKIERGVMTLALHAEVVNDHFDQYDGPLSPAVERLILAYGATPDGADDFLGLAEEDCILRHNETGALLICGLIGHAYVAEHVEGKITIVTTAIGDDFLRGYDDGSSSALEDALCIDGLDAEIVAIDPPDDDCSSAEVVLQGRATLQALADLSELPCVSDVDVR